MTGSRRSQAGVGVISVFAAAGGVVLDQLLGEPPLPLHPVACYGTTMQWIEQRTYASERRAGVVHLAIGIGFGAVAGIGVRRLVGPTVARALAALTCVAGRMLDDEAATVGRMLTGGDLVAARERVRSLVGRTTADLDEREISRAVIESVAENCVDAVTASAFWAVVGGAPAALAHRAINTLDAMVGHHTPRYEHFGWASARLDDLVNYVPARLTVASVLLVRPKRAAAIVRAVRHDAPQHPSPNGGVVEAAFAAALGVRLGGRNVYGDESGLDVQDRGTLGDGRPAGPLDIAAAIRLRRHCTAAFLAVLGGAASATSAVVQAVRRRR